MHIPQILMIVLLSSGLLVAAHNHGKPPKQKLESFWATLVATSISVGLLIWGGFFR